MNKESKGPLGRAPDCPGSALPLLGLRQSISLAICGTQTGKFFHKHILAKKSIMGQFFGYRCSLH